MLEMWGFTAEGRDTIRLVHDVLEAFDPELIAHFNLAITEVKADAGQCTPGAAACVLSNDPRVAYIVVEPEFTPILELATYLTHEARHWQLGPYGWYVFPHQCADPFCRRPEDLQHDPVYLGDEAFRPRLEAPLRAAGLDPSLPLYQRPHPAPASPRGMHPAAAFALGFFGALAIGLGVKTITAEMRA